MLGFGHYIIFSLNSGYTGCNTTNDTDYPPIHVRASIRIGKVIHKGQSEKS
jgi:hypothetical protein